MKHTQGKWETHPVTDFNVVYVVVNGEAEEICRTPNVTPTDKANARRIVAAVNATEGMTIEEINEIVNVFKRLRVRVEEQRGAIIDVMNDMIKHGREIPALRAQNARLLEALKRVADHFDMDGYHSDAWKNLALEMAETARAAIAEAENTEPTHTRATII